MFSLAQFMGETFVSHVEESSSAHVEAPTAMVVFSTQRPEQLFYMPKKEGRVPDLPIYEEFWRVGECKVPGPAADRRNSLTRSRSRTRRRAPRAAPRPQREERVPPPPGPAQESPSSSAGSPPPASVILHVSEQVCVSGRILLWLRDDHLHAVPL